MLLQTASQANLPRRNLFNVLEDNPAPEPDTLRRDCSTSSTDSESSEGSEAGGTLGKGATGIGDRCTTTSAPAAFDTSDIDPGTRIRPGTDIRIGIGIGIALGNDIRIGEAAAAP